MLEDGDRNRSGPRRTRRLPLALLLFKIAHGTLNNGSRYSSLLDRPKLGIGLLRPGGSDETLPSDTVGLFVTCFIALVSAGGVLAGTVGSGA